MIAQYDIFVKFVYFFVAKQYKNVKRNTKRYCKMTKMYIFLTKLSLDVIIFTILILKALTKSAILLVL